VHQNLGHEKHAAEDMETAAALMQTNLETYGIENNVWCTRHMQVEDYLQTELER
jgi:hypothetical protein